MNSSFRWLALKQEGRGLDSKRLLGKLLRHSSPDFWFASSEVGGGDDLVLYRRVSVPLERLDSRGEREVYFGETISKLGLALREGKDQTLLRVSEPGRNLRSLLDLIENVAGFGLSSRSLTLEAGQVERILAKFEVSNLVGLKITNVSVGSDCVGRMEFASKSGVDVTSIRVLRGLNYKLEFAKYELLYHATRGFFSYTSGGLIKLGGPLTPRILNVVESQIAKSKAPEGS